jgi:Type II restriction endonuclease EcoO109I
MAQMALNKKEIVANVRATSGLASGKGPDDDRIFEAVGNFVEAFDYWYIRVMREAVAKYRQLIIARINPFIRRIQCDGLDAAEAAALIVEDYNSRNFVTAGGWAIEALATGVRPEVRKSGIAGIDLDRFDASTGEYHLYVLKSGLVTRNSDIISALKRNARAAEKQLHQSKTTKSVRANYAIAAGKTTSTFEDGVWRPSSEEFWAEMFDMDVGEEAVDLALAIALEAGRLVRRDASEHVKALRMLVADYIADRKNDSLVDWDFIARRTMRNKDTWTDEDKERHNRALERLAKTGYAIASTKTKRSP